jgi:hypothetical protein
MDNEATESLNFLFSAKQQLLRFGPKTSLYNTAVGRSLFARVEKKAG